MEESKLLISEKFISEIKNKGLYNFNITPKSKIVKHSITPKKIISFYIENNQDNKFFFKNIESKFSEGLLKYLSICEDLQLNILIYQDNTIKLDTFISFNNSILWKMKEKKIINKNQKFSFIENIYIENDNFYIKKSELNPINKILLKYYDIIIKNYKEKIITIIKINKITSKIR